jgi:hypothetical protein
MAFKLQFGSGTICVCYYGPMALRESDRGHRPVVGCDVSVGLPAKSANTVFNCGLQDDRISA